MSQEQAAAQSRQCCSFAASSLNLFEKFVSKPEVTCKIHAWWGFFCFSLVFVFGWFFFIFVLFPFSTPGHALGFGIQVFKTPFLPGYVPEISEGPHCCLEQGHVGAADLEDACPWGRHRGEEFFGPGTGNRRGRALPLLLNSCCVKTSDGAPAQNCSWRRRVLEVEKTSCKVQGYNQTCKKEKL